MLREVYVTDIVVPRSAFDSGDPSALVNITIDYLNALFDRGQLHALEVPRAAVLSYQVDYWSAQVCNGGHGQFYGNSVHEPSTLDRVEAGLAAMAAGAYADIFASFRALIASDAARAARIAEGCGFGEIDPAIASLDTAFFALGSDRLLALNNGFLRSQKTLVVVPDAELDAAWTAMAARSPHVAARRAEGLARRAAAESADPTYLAARALCSHCGIEFERFTAGHPVSGGAMLWGMVTSGGIRLMRLDGRAAALFTSSTDAEADRGALARVTMADGRPGRPSSLSKLRKLLGI